MNTTMLKQSIQTFAEATFSCSGGPGGQNVNKLNTKVILKMRLSDLSGLSDAELERVKTVLANRISKTSARCHEGEIVITSDEERSQRINLERAYLRMGALIAAAAKLPKRRRPTKPSKAAKEARLQAKKRHSQKKAERTQKSFT